MAAMPALAAEPAKLVVWTWDRAEDLRFLPAEVGVAPVEASIELHDDKVLVRPRFTRLLVRADAELTPVVHVDALPAWRAQLNAVQRERIVDVAEAVARRYGRKAVQVDFEALPSQRVFYADVLKQLRARLPGHRISVTALVSWCADDTATWLQQLPVDEVVAMPFRMGNDSNAWRGKVRAFKRWPNYACTASSMALDEPELSVPATSRQYLFSTRAWTPDLWQEARTRARKNQRSTLFGVFPWLSN